MAEPRRIKARIIQKHATAAEWNAKSTFIPLEGEVIIYDQDDTYDYERFKIGDGITSVVNLPFVHVEHASNADRLGIPRNIILNGDIHGSVAFDGSKDVILETSLQGSFSGEFTGTPQSHTHTFKGTGGTVIASYTPEGTVQANYTPSGTISTPTITLNPSVKTIDVITNAGTEATYVKGSCVFPTLKGTLSGDELALNVTGGSYTPGTYTPGALASKTTISYIEDITATSSQPTFQGKQGTINSTFTGKDSTITALFTPEGTIENTSITPEGEIEINYNND